MIRKPTIIDKKKETGLTIGVKKAENFPDWYTAVITAAELIDYYDISGCYILRPTSYQIWEEIQDFLNGCIKKSGVKNAYFPLFVAKGALEREKEHVEGFAPEVAWVTRSGSSDLPEPIAIRPTSETIMYPAYARWIRGHRDLPLRLNQWTNVVRWEFKNPTPFIRTREFLWQEGHSAFATKEEADKEVLEILDYYARVYEELLAVPVIKGRKSEKEKFAGGLYTTTIEAFIPGNGRAVQAATSHCLGQNFSKMFNISFEDENGERKLVWQNSWGLTTRSIGVMCMVHGDDQGLVMPPRVAPTQVVIIPIYTSKNTAEEIKELKDKADEFYSTLKAAGVRVEIDERDNYTPGWKYHYWEQRGIPLRVEIGPKDMANKQVCLARRDDLSKNGKSFVSWDNLDVTVKNLLETIQASMLNKARAERDNHIKIVFNWKEFMQNLDGNLVLAPWCEKISCEEAVKTRTVTEADQQIGPNGELPALSGAAKTLCIPFNQTPIEGELPCFQCGCHATCYALWGRSY
ncbi:hypothetical protein WA158_004808 [Blastocystis sp. Blastoise]